MFLAIKEMKKEKGRFAMIILVTSLIAYLVYFLTGLAFGLAKANTTSVDQWEAETIVLSSSANQNIYSSSIDEDVYKKIDIKNGELFNIANAVVTIKGDKEQHDLVFMGFENVDSPLIPKITEGRKAKLEDEIVVTESFKKTSNIKLNDMIKVLRTEREFKVVGFTEVAEYNTQPVGYSSLEMASQAMMMYKPEVNEKAGETETAQGQGQPADATTGATADVPNRVSGIIVKNSVPKKVLKDNGLEALSKKEFINAIPGYQAQLLTFGLMIVSMVLIAAVIIGIFMYILTMQKKSMFAILKIQGISNKFISQSVIVQTLLISLLGLVVGLGLTVLTFNLLPVSVPVKISWPIYGVISLLSLAFSLLGTIFSAKSILKIDPLDAL